MAANTFVELNDTPSNYTGSGKKFLVVKGDGGGLQFTTPSLEKGRGGTKGAPVNAPHGLRPVVVPKLYNIVQPLMNGEQWTMILTVLVQVY